MAPLSGIASCARIGRLTARGLTLCLATSIGVVLPLASTPVAGLEIGFEARTYGQASDNIAQADAGLEEDGTLGFASVGLYGEQLGTRASGGFEGRIDTRRRFDDENDDDWDSVTSFFGAVDVQLTPRVLSWYVGDVLGGVRLDDTDQPVNEFGTRRRNVFVTGPRIEWDIDSANRIDARLLYLNQSEEGDELESLYDGFIEYRRERVPGQRFGLRVSDIYTDGSQLDDGEDLNRLSASAFIERERGFWLAVAELGATRYDTDDETVDGVVAELGLSRQLGPVSTIGVSLRRDLSDQTLDTVNGLLGNGSAVRQDADGVFQTTRLEIVYGLAAAENSIDIGAGVAQIDYQVLLDDAGATALADEQDQRESYAFLNLSRQLGTRFRLQFGARYERETLENLDDETDSAQVTLGGAWRLSRSFELEAGYLFDRIDGLRTEPVGGERASFDVDRTENRFGLGLRWAPPSRATRDLTIELKSLIR